MIPYQNFFSPEVKRSVVIINKDDIYELPHEQSNDLSVRILGNKERSGKSQNFTELQASSQSFHKNKNFFDTKKTCWKLEIKIFP